MADMQELVKQLAHKAQEQHEKALKDAHDKRIDDFIKTLSALYDKAAAYSNLIMAAGYAAFFAVWVNVKPFLTPFQMRASALAMTLSLVVFVTWELAKMIRVSRNLQRQFDLSRVEPRQYDERLAEYKKAERQFNVTFLKAWSFVLVAAIFPAIVAVSIILYAFVVGLFDTSPITL